MSWDIVLMTRVLGFWHSVDLSDATWTEILSTRLLRRSRKKSSWSGRLTPVRRTQVGMEPSIKADLRCSIADLGALKNLISSLLASKIFWYLFSIWYVWFANALCKELSHWFRINASAPWLNGSMLKVASRRKKTHGKLSKVIAQENNCVPTF